MFGSSRSIRSESSDESNGKKLSYCAAVTRLPRFSELGVKVPTAASADKTASFTTLTIGIVSG